MGMGMVLCGVRWGNFGRIRWVAKQGRMNDMFWERKEREREIFFALSRSCTWCRGRRVNRRRMLQMHSPPPPPFQYDEHKEYFATSHSFLLHLFLPLPLPFFPPPIIAALAASPFFPFWPSDVPSAAFCLK